MFNIALEFFPDKYQLDILLYDSAVRCLGPSSQRKLSWRLVVCEGRLRGARRLDHGAALGGTGGMPFGGAGRRSSRPFALGS